MQSEKSFFSSRRQEWLFILLPLLGLGLGLRLLVFSHTKMINPDGMVYILQAKALYLQQSDKFLTVYPWPTNLAFFLAGAYRLVGDWILAGRLVSLLFSLATIIPLYFFLRLYTTRLTAAALALFYVASPAFVEYSGQILRGPEFWFFLCSGLWGYGRIQSLGEKKAGMMVYLLTSTAFILAAWSRIEGLLPLLLAGGGIVISCRRHRRRDLAAYFAPYLTALALACLPLLGWRTIAPSNNLFKIIYNGVVDRATAAWAHFTWLKSSLRELQKSPPFGVAPYFFKQVRHHLYLLALGITGDTLLKLFGLPYLLVLLYGRLRSRPATPATGSRLPLLPGLIIAGGILIIYIEILLRWASSPRFAALVFFPALLLAAPGCEKILAFATAADAASDIDRETRHRLRNLAVWALLLTLVCLPAILKRSRTDRSTAFREIGLELAQSKLSSGPPLKLCGTSRKILYTHFFTYLKKAVIYSPDKYCSVYYIKDLDLDTLLRNGCRLLLLSDRDHGRQWLRKELGKRPEVNAKVLFERFNTELHGRITLYLLTSKTP